MSLADGIHAAASIGEQALTLLAYSDESSGMKPTVALSAGAIGGVSAAVLALFGGLAALLAKPGTGKVILEPEEETAVQAVYDLYDVSEDDKVLTESGTRGEVRRRKLADEAKAAYQRGKDSREVRDKTLAYGEFELRLLAVLLRYAKPQEGDVFWDLGSGTGKAVLAASLLHPWSECVGVELLPGLHKQAQGYASKLGRVSGPYKSPVRFVNKDFCDSSLDVSQADVVFAYATRYATEGGVYLTELAEKLRSLKPGARVITIDRRLRGSEWRLVKTLEDPRGDLQLTTGFVWEKTK